MKLKRFLDDQFSLGKGAVKLPISSLLEQYRKRYTILRKTYKTFKHTVWYVQPDGRTIIHFKIPSETIHGFCYDVLLELDRSGGATKFEDCNVKVFSNCPSFVFTYANVFYTMKDSDTGKDGIIIDKFNQKIPKDRLLVKGSEKTLPKESLTNAPTIRNPGMLNLPDKSVYFAIFYLIDELDFRRVLYSRHNISMSRLLQSIDHFDILMKKRKAAELKQRAQLRETKKLVKKVAKQREAELGLQSGIAASNKVRPVGTIKQRRSGNVRKVRATSPVSKRQK